jgi:hypothetical protein
MILDKLDAHKAERVREPVQVWGCLPRVPAVLLLAIEESFSELETLLRWRIRETPAEAIDRVLAKLTSRARVALSPTVAILWLWRRRDSWGKSDILSVSLTLSVLKRLCWVLYRQSLEEVYSETGHKVRIPLWQEAFPKIST